MIHGHASRSRCGKVMQHLGLTIRRNLSQDCGSDPVALHEHASYFVVNFAVSQKEGDSKRGTA